MLFFYYTSLVTNPRHTLLNKTNHDKLTTFNIPLKTCDNKVGEKTSGCVMGDVDKLERVQA